VKPEVGRRGRGEHLETGRPAQAAEERGRGEEEGRRGRASEEHLARVGNKQGGSLNAKEDLARTLPSARTGTFAELCR